MWRNTDVDAFVDWLRTYNERVESERRAGFYGLDLYSMNGSIAAVIDYLDKVDPDAAAVARERYGCLTPWQKDPATYGHAVLTDRYRKCEQAVVQQCRDGQSAWKSSMPSSRVGALEMNMTERRSPG